jgi:hypothetical protein
VGEDRVPITRLGALNLPVIYELVTDSGYADEVEAMIRELPPDAHRMIVYFDVMVPDPTSQRGVHAALLGGWLLGQEYGWKKARRSAYGRGMVSAGAYDPRWFDEVSEPERRTICIVCFQHRTLAEAAAEEGISESGIRARLRRAAKKIGLSDVKELRRRFTPTVQKVSEPAPTDTATLHRAPDGG